MFNLDERIKKISRGIMVGTTMLAGLAGAAYAEPTQPESEYSIGTIQLSKSVELSLFREMNLTPLAAAEQKVPFYLAIQNNHPGKAYGLGADLRLRVSEQIVPYARVEISGLVLSERSVEFPGQNLVGPYSSPSPRIGGGAELVLSEKVSVDTNCVYDPNLGMVCGGGFKVKF
jgi:hypothetical protein